MWSSAPPPTAAEEARIVFSKIGPCMACMSLVVQGLLDIEQVFVGGDYQHTKSGNIRRGHWFGFCLCVWHHRRHPFGKNSFAQMREKWGPSLMDGSRTFHETYGTDDELIAQQTYINEIRQAA